MFTTKGRYALRVMIDLAEHEDSGYIPLKEIAERQMISEKYLESILKSLVRAELLKGLRGKGGGYILTRKPSEYPVGEIIEIVEGTLASVACLTSDAEPCEKASNCQTLPLWQNLDKIVHDYLYTVTIADLVNKNV